MPHCSVAGLKVGIMSKPINPKVGDAFMRLPGWAVYRIIVAIDDDVDLVMLTENGSNLYTQNYTLKQWIKDGYYIPTN